MPDSQRVPTDIRPGRGEVGTSAGGATSAITSGVGTVSGAGQRPSFVGCPTAQITTVRHAADSAVPDAATWGLRSGARIEARSRCTPWGAKLLMSWASPNSVPNPARVPTVGDVASPPGSLFAKKNKATPIVGPSNAAAVDITIDFTSMTKLHNARREPGVPLVTTAQNV